MAEGRPYTRLTGALCMRTVKDAGPYARPTEGQRIWYGTV